jgi:uncharacterized damage-inducible protein DinB
MFSQEQLVDFSRYNQWANSQLISLFNTMENQLIEQELISSFPSIRKTLLHLWDVETLWLKRLKKEAATEFPSKQFTGSNHVLYQNLLDKSSEFAAFVGAQPAAYFTEPLEFTFLTTPGQQAQLPMDMILHCCNHQTMHRGQLITMARQLGVTTFPRTDYIIWVRDVKNKH